MTTREQGLARLLRLANILDKADAVHDAKREPRYYQERYVHACGTPACALGHWAAANPRRWGFRVNENGVTVPFLRRTGEASLDAAQEEFRVSTSEASELFQTIGCGYAQTAAQAAAYIREFVERKRKETP